MATFSTQTIETALLILAEWNAKSRVPVAICKPDGARLFREALRDVKALERLSRSIGRRAEYACNFPMSEAERAKADRDGERDAGKVAAILKPWGLSAKIEDGNPLAAAIKIKTPNTGRFNGMGGASDGWCV